MSLQRSGTRRRVAAASPIEPQGNNAFLHRSATRRGAGVAPLAQEKKGYAAVKQGIKQLYPREGSNEVIDIDIVFVPGLGAHPETSWKSTKSAFNWATDKEGIARDFPNARILLYMYESAWTGPFKVKQYMRNIAYTLLEGLNSMREASGTRPIVFIGHSMGGLVIAKAICIAESRQDLFPLIFEQIVGCTLFGTPFEGAEAASVAAMISHVAEKFDKAVNSKLLEFMARGNEGLRELRDEFVRVVNKPFPKISLYGFYEEHPTTIADLSGVPQFIRNLQIPLPEKIAQFVTRDSAILGGNMESMGLAANHRDLVKFESSKDERYALIRSSLKRLVHGAKLVVKNRQQASRRIDRDLLRKAREVLDGAQILRKRKSITIPPSSWIPEEPEYVKWLARSGGTQDHPKRLECLWIRGPEGRGKTSASLAALQGIEQMIEPNSSQGSTLLAYFFCDSAPDYDTAEELLKSLVRQLIDQHESLAGHTKFLLRKKGKDDAKSQIQLTVENLWQVLQDMLADVVLSGTKVYFVVNNLEALQQDSISTKTLVELLGLEIGNANHGRQATVRWMITSGPLRRIEQFLGGESVRLIDLDDEKYEDQVQLELRKHAREKVSELIVRKNYSKALGYYAGSLIGRRAQNTQWIDITIVQLEQLPQTDNDLRVRLHLETVPQRLDELLTLAWSRVFELSHGYADEIKEILRVLVLTYEDPTVEELRLLTDLYSTKEQKTELENLLEKCKPLLNTKRIMSETKVCFIEPVVRTHLLENSYKLLGLSDEDIKLQHGMLGFRAFSHIMEVFSFPAATDNIGGDEQSTHGDLQEHIEQSQADDDEIGDHPDGSADGNQTHAEGELEGQDDSENEETDEDEDDAQDPQSDADEWEDSDEEEEDEDPEASLLKDKALAYAVKHCLPHASKATAELAEVLSSETEFWKLDSVIRRRWLTEHSRLTDSFKYYYRAGLPGLHVAAAIGFKHLVIALMKNGHQHEKDLRDPQNFTPLHYAAGFGQSDIIEELLNRGAQVDDGMEDRLMTPLHMAASEGNVKAMDTLLQRNANPNADCGAYGGVINAAIQSGNREAVKLLVDMNVSLVALEVPEDDTREQSSNMGIDDIVENDSAKNNNEEDDSTDGSESESESESDDEEEVIRSPLALAASRSDLTMLQFLLEEYREKLPAKDFDTALTKAADYGRLEAFQLLVNLSSHTPEALQSSLNAAAYSHNWDIVTFILEVRSGLNCDYAFHCAAVWEDGDQEIQILEALWEYSRGKITAEILDQSLYEATDYENENTVRLLLRFGANPNATGPEYGNALTAAAYDGRLDIVTMLLDANANINSPDGWPLQTAAGEDHRKIVDLLLERRVDVNAFTTHDEMPQATALQAAVEARNRDTVDLLLAHGANPDLGGGQHTCPIIAATRLGEKDILDSLIRARANVNVYGGDYQGTPLIYAAMSLYQPSLRSLLDAGADINLTDEFGDTALMSATDAESVQYLLDQGADVLHRNNQGKNVLQCVVEKNDKERIQIVVNHVSVILDALRVAMESGDAAVTAVVRSVESRKQGLEYDEVSTQVETNVPVSHEIPEEQNPIHQATETHASSSILNTPAQEKYHKIFEEDPQGTVAATIPYHSQSQGNPSWYESDSRIDSAAPPMWKPYNPSPNPRPEPLVSDRREPPQIASQSQQTWTVSASQQNTDYRALDPPQVDESQTASSSSGQIRRKPLTSPPLQDHNNGSPSASRSHHVNQPPIPPAQYNPHPYPQRVPQLEGMSTRPAVHATPYQTQTQSQPPQRDQGTMQTQFSQPSGSQLNQYRAYQPQPHPHPQEQYQHQHAVSYGNDREGGINQQSHQPLTQQSPFVSPGRDTRYQGYDSGDYNGRNNQRLQNQPSRSFLGMKAPW